MASEWDSAVFGCMAEQVRSTVQPSEAAGMPYIALEHIGEGTLSLIGVGKAVDATSAKSLFREGDILFGKLRPYFRKVVRAPFDGICSTDIWVVRPREDVDPGYLFYLMASDLFVEPVVRASEGTKMPRAKWEYAASLELPRPTLPEQRAIAHILGTLDDKIELNRRMAHTLEEMARALFKSWFVDFEPVRAKMDGRWRPGESLPGLPAHLYDLFPNRLVDSELGPIPEGWEIKSLDQIAMFLNGLALQKYPPADDGRFLPVIKIAQLRSGTTRGADKASADLDAAYVVDDGDVLFSWSGSLECVYWEGGRGALNQHLFKVTPLGYPKWLCYLAIHMHLPEFRHIAAGKATTMGHIQRHHLTDARQSVPPDNVIEAAGGLLGPLTDAMWRYATEARRVAGLRNRLLPALIEGEVRLESPERLLDDTV